jgi:hypothetical protein
MGGVGWPIRGTQIQLHGPLPCRYSNLDSYIIHAGKRSNYMMQIIYHLIVLYLTVQLIWFVIREKKIPDQLSGVIVLIVFLLRLFLIK